MKCEWKIKTVGELTSYISKGITPKYIDKKTNSTIVVLNQKCNRDYKVSYEQSRLHDTTKKAVPTDKMLQYGDVLINSTGTGTAGRIAQFFNNDISTTVDGHMIIMRASKEIDYLYYGYALKSYQKKIESFAEGSTGQTEINKQRLQEELLIKYPQNIDLQRSIALILKNIDDKIELNNRINENLEQQAQALYKSCFIDMLQFEGTMPSDWHIGTVSEIIELHDAQRIPLSNRERADLAKIYPYYGATSIMDYVDRYLFDGIYLLLGEDGTVVDSNGFPILQYVEGKFWVNNHAHIITGKNGFSAELLYLLFSLTNVQSIVTGAVQPKISQANLKSIPVIIPSKDILQEFDATIQPIFAQIRNLRAENDRLSALRDTLLPKLMTGEIDVSEVEI